MTQTAHIKPNNRTYKKHEALGYSYYELAMFFSNFVGMIKTKTDLYFYHSDHLGSSSWITDASGTANQHLAYMPFAESFIDQRATTHDIRFKFTGKERDSETGFDYFGARYYSSGLSIWLSVDAMADESPSQSPFMYCSGNPFNRVDPTGMLDGWFEGEDKQAHFDPSVNSQKDMTDKGIKGNYIGATGGESGKDGYQYNLNADGTKTQQAESEITGARKTPTASSSGGDWDLNGDGKFQKNEADNRWLNGGGDVWVDNSKINWSGLKIPKGQTSGNFSISTTDAFRKLPWETAATYGGTSFEVMGPSQVRVLDQLYHYQYRPNNSAENMTRNFMTWFGLPGNGQGTDYTIHYNNPIFKIK